MKKILIALLTLLTLICACGLSACNKNKHKHTKSDWIIVEQASCRSKGLKQKKCLTCDEVVEIAVVSKAYEHNYVYGECIACEKIDSTYMTEGLVYALIDGDSEYKVTGYTGNSAEVIIPAIYRGKPVTSIGDETFSNCSFLTNIVIPNSVTNVGHWAFANCDNLNYNIKDGLKYLGNSENKYLYLAGTTSLFISSATINSNCRIIGDRAFYYCTALTNVFIPETVTSIGDYAFSSCTALTSMVISEAITGMGAYAFADCTSLTIYCKALDIPSGWSSDWNYSNCPVVWGYKG